MSEHPEDPELLVFYEQMMLIRRFDERALELFDEGRIHGTAHPYIGQEAIAVGVCSALEKHDRIVSNHRGHGHCLAKGADPSRMMAELFGRRDGYCGGKGGSMHVAAFEHGVLGANGVVGAGVPIAVGAALAERLSGGDRVTVVFFSDGATGQGVLYESINIAVLWNLPVLLVCENNRIGVATPLAAALPTEHLAPIAAAHGVDADVVDGNDVVAVHAAASEAVAALRTGHRPMLIECMTERLAIHSTSVAESRSAEMLARLRAGDPLPALRARMLDGGVSLAAIDAVEARVEERLTLAVEFADQSPFPDPIAALDGVFA